MVAPRGVRRRRRGLGGGRGNGGGEHRDDAGVRVPRGHPLRREGQDGGRSRGARVAERIERVRVPARAPPARAGRREGGGERERAAVSYTANEGGRGQDGRGGGTGGALGVEERARLGLADRQAGQAIERVVVGEGGRGRGGAAALLAGAGVDTRGVQLVVEVSRELGRVVCGELELAAKVIARLA